ncbi:hypothetical protein A2661_02600 [Candidatus Giovannonibacteria bacterium RIFCSPHIGHO2_01_FULL_45_24]|uniref:CHAT domain-containing protein n=1 Tax=Candidatus Giovannonibacteria bacterium RIFCSPLOWO2_01_FULL_46_32 TaxID=1798353 RepID=A0A1F5XI73_9BACT|nr:MAG: hypothetical protein A2661_02600 [Candidatus Giovannonibacteria bacterium RIFCSPHIGHO2_01_FULL_45_24]OGF87608.1 MAG: hypothetical protein A3B19_02320 [Candidatus Giovannonibacteria bacterium RIFCSPLOWO2_01_FULL_46_32]
MLLLITRPRHDRATHYLFYWAGLLIDEAKKRGVRVIDLGRDKASRKKLHSYLDKQPIDIVILNGHGNQEAVAGQDNKIILSAGNGTNLLNGKVIFVRACDAGAVLGKEIMKNGARGFIGYLQPFMFLIDKDSLNKPLEDKLAAPILGCSNQVGLSLIKGRSVVEAQKDSWDKYTETIDKYSSSEAINSFLLPILLWNMTNQVCYQ